MAGSGNPLYAFQVAYVPVKSITNKQDGLKTVICYK